MKRVFRNFLIGELAGVVVAIVVFQVITSRLLAGAIAGFSFVLLGAWIFWSGVRTSGVRRSMTFYVGSVHLFVISLPMLITRQLNPDIDFNQIHIWGLSGALFHSISTVVYFVMMAATVGDYLLAWRREAVAK